MEVRFNIQPEDVSAFWRYVRARRQREFREMKERAHTRLAWVLAGVAGTVAVIVLSVYNLWSRIACLSPIAVGICTFMGTVWLIVTVGWFLEQGAVGRHYKALKEKGLVDNVTVSISPEFLGFSTDLSTATYRWSLVEEVGQTDEHIVILLAKEDGYVVPWRAFNSRAEALLFLESAQRYCESR